MKNFLAASILILLLIGLIIPGMILGQTPPHTPKEECTMRHNVGVTVCPGPGSTATGACCILDAIYTITDWVFYVIFTLSIVMIVIGGGIYITAAGDPAKTEQGRGIIKYSIIGLIIALMAKMFPVAVRTVVGL